MAINGSALLPGPIPKVAIMLGDKERHLLFDFNALRIAEKQMAIEWGKKASVTSVLGEDITVTDLTILLWSALKHEDAGLTLDQVGAMLHPANLEYIADRVREAFGIQAATDEDEEVEASGDPLKP